MRFHAGETEKEKFNYEKTTRLAINVSNALLRCVMFYFNSIFKYFCDNWIRNIKIGSAKRMWFN
jgi:hypothetical protein